MHRVLHVVLFAFVLLAVCQSAFAAIMDLTATGLTGTSNGAIFAALSSGSGTGQYRSFLQVGDTKKDPDLIEKAYNSAYQVTADNPECGTSAQFNRLLQWPHLPAIENPLGREGWYIEFIGDANEVSGNPSGYISLDKFEVWLSPFADLGATGKYYADWGNLTNTTRIYSMAAGDWAAIDYNLSSGSGSGDIAVYVPWLNFRSYVWHSGVTAPYVYIYTQFGGQTGSYTVASSPTPVSNWTSSDGGEEWAHREEPFTIKDVPPQIPEPGTASLMGLGLLALVALRRRKAKQTA